MPLLGIVGTPFILLQTGLDRATDYWSWGSHDITNESIRKELKHMKHNAEQYGTPWNNMVYQKKISLSEHYQTGKSNSCRALYHVPSLHCRTGRPSTCYRCLPSCPLHHSPPQTGRPCPQHPCCCQKCDWVLHACFLPGHTGMC